MLNLGMSELLVFAIIAVIVLGPEKLPTAVRTVVKWYRQIKMLISNVQRDIERELEITEIREKMELEIARFKEIEQQMQAQLDQIQKDVAQLEEKEPSHTHTTPAALTTSQEPADLITSKATTPPTQMQTQDNTLQEQDVSTNDHPLEQHKKVASV